MKTLLQAVFCGLQGFFRGHFRHELRNFLSSFMVRRMKDTVYIYAGENKGSSVARMMKANFAQSFAKNGLHVRLIDAAQLLKEKWMDRALMLIWGGGESTRVRQALATDGNFRKDIIQTAHKEGVHFAGYCGGGFLGFDHITFEGIKYNPAFEATKYSLQGDGFGLYPRRSHGAAIGLTPKPFTGMSDSATILPLIHHATSKHFHALYCCGPYFPAHDLPDNANPLAIAHHPITGQEYILGVQIPSENSRGSVSLYGYHPEYLADFIHKRTHEVPSILQEDERLRTEASRNNTAIARGFNLMLDDLRIAMGLMPDKPQPLIVPQFQLA